MTPRRLSGAVVLATHNPGKIRELKALLEPFGLHCESATELGLVEPPETAATFAGNAAIKALAAARASSKPALADDSGLVVPALDGAPGVVSARWAGPKKDFRVAMRRVERELQQRGTGDRSAYFAAALSVAWPDGHTETFEGRIDGTLVWPPRGTRGFGYDPMFVAEGYDRTFGELDQSMKHAISHRARAFHKLVAACLA